MINNRTNETKSLHPGTWMLVPNSMSVRGDKQGLEISKVTKFEKSVRLQEMTCSIHPECLEQRGNPAASVVANIGCDRPDINQPFERVIVQWVHSQREVRHMSGLLRATPRQLPRMNHSKGFQSWANIWSRLPHSLPSTVRSSCVTMA